MLFNTSKLNQSKHNITKDTPIFCYVSESKENFVAKLQDIELSLNINLDTTLTKDENNQSTLIDTKFIFLSFIPFKNDKEANTKSSQKFQLTHKDLEKACKIINFNIPYAYLNESEMFGEWEGEKKEKKISIPLSLEFNGKALIIIINKNDTIERISFQAVSGRPQEINNKYYFTYEKERQMLKVRDLYLRGSISLLL